MHLGVKFGDDNWQPVLEKTKAEYAEVWFRIEWEERYGELFEYLKKNKINFGLHFWAEIEGGFLPNLAYEKNNIAQKTEAAVRKNIDIAQKAGAYYVNIHPGALTLEQVDLNKMEAKVVPESKISYEESLFTLKKHCLRLNRYAKEKNVLLLVETVPKNEADNWREDDGRLSVQQSYNLPPEALLELVDVGIYLSNDIGHLISSWISDDRDFLYKKTLDFTKKAKNATKLIHLNTVAPPFNGTDSHHGILPQDFAQNVVPNKEQLRELLALFKNRDDVWVIPEPKAELMAENYFEAKRMFNM